MRVGMSYWLELSCETSQEHESRMEVQDVGQLCQRMVAEPRFANQLITEGIRDFQSLAT